jgi:hypothetical protein
MIHSGEFTAVAGFVPLLRTATVTGTSIELKAQAGPCLITINAGAITDGTHTPKLQDSPDDSTWTDTTDYEGTTLVAITANSVQQVSYKGYARYVRAVVTVTGSPGTGGTYGCIMQKQTARV